MAWLILINAGAQPSDDFGLITKHADLRLNQPYLFESIDRDYEGNVEVRWTPRGEPLSFFRAMNAETLQDLCSWDLTTDLRTENPDSLRRYQCTDVILSRACHETREKINLPIGGRTPEPSVDAVE